MKSRTLQLILLASVALCPLAASAQRGSTQLSPERIKSSGLMVITKDKQGEERATTAAARMNVDRRALEQKTAASVSPLPDLAVTQIGTAHDPVTGALTHLVLVENKGKANAAACKLRFMYGMTWDALESTDISVPAIAAGKSAKIVFAPPDKPVHWWMFGVDVGNQLGEANFSNNLYLVEFKD